MYTLLLLVIGYHNYARQRLYSTTLIFKAPLLDLSVISLFIPTKTWLSTPRLILRKMTNSSLLEVFSSVIINVYGNNTSLDYFCYV